jgi:release factor H-coupled RctB family protein
LKTPLGNRVVCQDKDLLFEEAPEAYKRIDQVIASLVDSGLMLLIARLRPVLTYKTAKSLSS